jgi:hypothetical protein
MATFLHKALSYEVRGVLFDVYNTLGPMLPERFYQAAVALGLDMKHLNVTYCLIANFNRTQLETKIINTSYKSKQHV